MKIIIKITIIFCSLLFLSFADEVYASEALPKEILILNSYHSGFEWTDDQTEGILDTISSYEKDYNVSTEYLDWKRYPSEEAMNYNYQLLKYKYDNLPLDVILCTDDVAFQFALQYRSEIFNNAPIVFSGVNSEGFHDISQGFTNYTGVIERLEPDKLFQQAKLINPTLSKIYIIYENTESGKSTSQLCIRAAYNVDPSLEIISWNDKSSIEILDMVTHIDKNSMVLISSYYTDIYGITLNHEAFCKKLSDASPVPVYHLFDFSLGTGVIGGHVLSGNNQGIEAGKLALKILDGESASNIEVINQDISHDIFDYNALKKFDIPLSILPKNSKIINKPFSFFETYRLLVITAAVIFFILLAFVIILLFYIKKIRFLQHVLTNNHLELLQLHNEQTAAEEELRAQYDEITMAHQKLEDYSSKLYHQAHHDNLTGLYNRLYLIDVFERELRLSQITGSLFYIDIDNFKYVNDALGHSIGDELLRKVSIRLQNLVGDSSTVTRLGGDEFVIISNALHLQSDICSYADEIIQQFILPFEVSGNILNISVSIGIAIYPENGTTLDEILQNADMSMFRVKSKGRNGYRFYQPELKQELMERINIESKFKKALKNQEFLLHFQPQIKITANGKCVVGLEALARWNEPELGFIPPVKFIPIAEETGFITELGKWILHTACTQAVSLNQTLDKELEISVNISVIQLMQVDFVNIVLQILKDTGLKPQLLNLEITESVIMESMDLFLEKLKELRNLGVCISLDDFGTGYSSLAYLREIPITTLKIDKLFVDDICKADLDINIVDTIIDLGHKLNLTVVAEGVETEEQLLYLIKNNCDIAQGYYYAKPMSISELEKFLQN